MVLCRTHLPSHVRGLTLPSDRLFFLGLYIKHHHHGKAVWQSSSMGLMNGLTLPPGASLQKWLIEGSVVGFYSIMPTSQVS
jgi:hypothetical protein